MRRLLLTVCFFAQIFIASAQTWETGVSVGASGYMGDINPVKPYSFTDIAYGAQVKRNFNGYWAAKLGFLQGKIRGDDAKSSNAYQNDRNLNFRSAISELSLQVELNLFNYLPGDLPGFGSRRLSPFIFAGVGAVGFNPVTDYNGSEVELQPVQTEAVEYKKYAVSVPYGAGIKYNIKGNWNLIADIGYRTAFTDYLDDISGRYPDFTVTPPASTLSPILSDRSITQSGTAGTQRGDFRKKDTYMFSTVSITYTFVSIKCPMF
ncbi:MAG: DUF6089 family protein [Daejeonella sp.]